jgi:hypothetical protein
MGLPNRTGLLASREKQKQKEATWLCENREFSDDYHVGAGLPWYMEKLLSPPVKSLSYF